MLSGFVYPGMGQFAQRRWAVGLLYGGAFTILFLGFMAICLRTVILYYRLGLYGETPGRLPPLGATLVLFAACIGVYLANVGDACTAYRRSCRRAALQRHLPGLAGRVDLPGNPCGNAPDRAASHAPQPGTQPGTY